MALNSQSLFSSIRSRPNVFVLSPRKLNLNPDDFMPRKSSGCKTSNAFMIYRTIYGKILSQKGLPSKMTEVSRWASQAWKVESDELKNEYREFAKKVGKIYRERAKSLGVQRILHPILPTPSDNFVRSQIEEQPVTFNSNYQEPFQLLSNFPTFCEPNYPLVHDDIYLPQLRQCEVCQLSDCCCSEEDNVNIRMQELPWVPTTIPAYGHLFWQNVYENDINMDMDNFDNSFN
jgi:hypothetical protein